MGSVITQNKPTYLNKNRYLLEGYIFQNTKMNRSSFAKCIFDLILQYFDKYAILLSDLELSKSCVLKEKPIITQNLAKLLCDKLNATEIHKLFIRKRGSGKSWVQGMFDVLNVAAINFQKEFHTKCDNKGPTITIFSQPLSSKCIYGGYTSISWTSPYYGKSYKSDKNAFLFKITNKEDDIRIFDINPLKHEYAVCHDGKMGPCFGQNDLSIEHLIKEWVKRTAPNRFGYESSDEGTVYQYGDINVIFNAVGQTYIYYENQLFERGFEPYYYETYQVISSDMT